MRTTIRRTYHPTATNGEWLDEQGRHLCFTIELPWRNNQNRISCIPEGSYLLTIYQSPRHGKVILLRNVPKRDMIEVHASNFAIPHKDPKTKKMLPSELLGCIGPVTSLDEKTPGIGWSSRDALKKINDLIMPAIERGEDCWLTIEEA